MSDFDERRTLPETVERVIALYKDGMKLAAITRETGVPRSGIFWILSKNGITPDRIASPSVEAITVTDLLTQYGQAMREQARLEQVVLDLTEENQTLKAQVAELKKRKRST